MNRIRVLLVDDQSLFAESLKTVIDLKAEDVEVVGIASDGAHAIELVVSQRPDVVLMDVRMPEMDGVQATEILHERFPDLKIIILTTFDDDEYVFEALNKGASGYLLKNITADNLIGSLRAVANGNVLLSPVAAEKLSHRPNSTARPAPASHESSGPATVSWVDELSEREFDVLRLIAQGDDNQKIADQLYLGLQTVKNYVYFIYSKSGIHNRIHLIKTVQDLGILDSGDRETTS